MKNRKLYVGTDDNGRPTYKIVGDFKQSTESSSTDLGNYDLKAELLLRPALNGSASIQRELYLYNGSQTTQRFSTVYAEDTELGPDDKVPIYDLGNSHGIYIENGKDDSQATYRMVISNQVPDGFEQYTAQKLGGWLAAFKPNNLLGTGEEINHNQAGKTIVSGVDTSYTLKWNPTTLKPGQVAHFGTAMGFDMKGNSDPDTTKTYTNETTKDGKNHIGDKLKFNLKVVNNGFNSNWNFKQLTDKLPQGLQLDSKSITVSVDGGTSENLSASDFDQDNNTLNIEMGNCSLKDKHFATISYEATITGVANESVDVDNNLTNIAKFVGRDSKPDATDKSYPASVKIPIDLPLFKDSLTKELKNESSDKDYVTTTRAKKGDIIDFRIRYKVMPNSKYYVRDAKIVDDLPDGLKLINGSIVSTNQQFFTTMSQTGVRMGVVKPGETFEYDYKVKVTTPIAKTITSSVVFSEGTINDENNSVPASLTSNPTVIKTKNVDAITSVPSAIDFGTTNLYGKTKVLSNVKTVGELIVGHPEANNFNVSVAYDNNDSNSRMKTKQGETLESDSEGILFIKQRKDNPNDLGTWKPVGPEGTSIQSSQFSGGQDPENLTNYVGAKDWRLKLVPNTKKGSYSGTLTWSMNDSIPNN